MTLSLGMRGPEVIQLQRLLKERGFNPGSLDGDFGPRTEVAVKAFQVARGLEPDGDVGPKTKAALQAIIVSPPKSVNREREGEVPWYEEKYAEMEIDKGYEKAVHNDTLLVLKGEGAYRFSEHDTGIPWWILGGLHFKEATCDFKAVLHNGERIVGTGLKTTLVPEGRGPFKTWREATIDAVQGPRWKRIRAGDLSVGEVLYAVERFNGTGHIDGAGRDDTSPYLWARTTINDDFGKYVRDGFWDPNATTQKTSGFAAIMKTLERLGIISLTSLTR